MTAIRRRIPLFPLIVLLLAGGLIAWMFATAAFVRSFAAIGLVLLSAILISLWWALRAKGWMTKLVRLGIVVLAGFVLIFAGKKLFRYEGSADGSALPSFTWRWNKPKEMAALHSQTAAAADLGPVPANLSDWTRFMGPNGDGMLPPPKWNTDWAAHPPREAWRQPVGLGWSGFAVLGRRAITQEQRGEEECVTCYDIVTGKLLWAHADKALFAEDMGGHGPRSTPSINATTGLVYTQGATGVLNCLDAATGALKWTRQVLTEADAKNIEWGKSNSPLLLGDRVIVTGGRSGPTLVAYRQDNGEPVWKAGTDAASYATPAVLTLAGREQIVSVNQTSVTGHDVADGKMLWTFPWPGAFPKVAQPILTGPDRVLVSSSYSMKSHLLEIKPSSDGGFTSNAIWTGTAPRTKFSSVTILDGRAVGIDEGTFASVDLATGERGWREGRYGYGQHLQLGDVLLIQTEPGPVVLARVSKDKLTELGRIDALSSKTWNPPTLAGNWLLVRNDREAVCYELQ